MAAWSAANDTSLTLVLNSMLEPSADKLAKFVKTMLKNGGKVEMVEMGNEVYHEGQRGKLLPKPKDYFKVASKLAAGLKKRVTGLKVGLPFSTENWAWNKSLTQADIDYDGIILHLYAYPSSIASTEDDQYLLEYPHKFVPELLKRLRELAPRKPFWITEWGILDRPLYRRNNSHIGTLFSANMLISLMRESDVQAACFHSLFDPNFGLFRFLLDATADMFYDNRKLSQQYMFWVKMREIFNNYEETSSLQVLGPDGKPAGPEVQIQAFRSQKRQALIIINNSIVSNTLSFEGLDIKKFTNQTFFIDPSSPIKLTSFLKTIPPHSIAILERMKEDRTN